ncbi:MAG: hypothetical protein QXV32_00565 [Conexivisphaerales archaeon]
MKVIAACICHKGDSLMIYDTEKTITLPSTIVNDDLSIEIALNNFFTERGWKIALGNLRYLLEEFNNEGKTLHLVYIGNVLREGKQNELKFININKIDFTCTYPRMLFGKILADKDRWNQPSCTTLVSW